MLKTILIRDSLFVIARCGSFVDLLSPEIALCPGTFFFFFFSIESVNALIYCPPIDLAPSSVPLPISAPSLSALRFLFSSKLFLLSANSFSCLLSTPVNQYPKLPPAAAKTGYAQSDSLLKKGRISIPSCQNRTARPSLHCTG